MKLSGKSSCLGLRSSRDRVELSSTGRNSLPKNFKENLMSKFNITTATVAQVSTAAANSNKYSITLVPVSPPKKF